MRMPGPDALVLRRIRASGESKSTLLAPVNAAPDRRRGITSAALADVGRVLLKLRADSR